MPLTLDPPRQMEANLDWRIELRSKADGSPKLQRMLCDLAKQDSLWFMESFCWLFEPRPRVLPSGLMQPSVFPFVAWPHQAPVIRAIEANLGRCDIGIEKSRAEGASWIVLFEFLRNWLFKPMQQFGLVSRTELAVDNPEDPDTPLWKLDWCLDRLPRWMRPGDDEIARSTGNHTLTNKVNGSAIVGYSATGDVARGGRKTAFMMDEIASDAWQKASADRAAMSSTQHVSDCRILVSTPGGPQGAYYDAMHQDGTMIRLVLDWHDNPTKNRGLYRIDKGVPTAENAAEFGELGTEYENAETWAAIKLKLEARGYRLDDEKTRSPWYDNECLRPGSTPRSMAQEVDRDYGGATSRFFDVGLIDRLIREKCHAMVTRGEIDFSLDGHEPEWVERLDGVLKLWFQPDVHGKPPRDRYVIGGDISMGTAGPKSSNSVLSITSLRTGRKVGEMATPRLTPAKLADYAIALCKWFADAAEHPAFLIWEDNGPGGQFRGRLVELSWIGFDQIYYRTAAKRVSRKKTQVPGFWSGGDSKRELLSSYETALRNGTMENPCKESLEEMKGFMNFAGGRVAHIAENTEDDPSGAGVNHADRVIADALCNWVLKDGIKPVQAGKSKSAIAAGEPPPGSFGWRQASTKRQQNSDSW